MYFPLTWTTQGYSSKLFFLTCRIHQLFTETSSLPTSYLMITSLQRFQILESQRKHQNSTHMFPPGLLVQQGKLWLCLNSWCTNKLKVFVLVGISILPWLFQLCSLHTAKCWMTSTQSSRTTFVGCLQVPWSWVFLEATTNNSKWCICIWCCVTWTHHWTKGHWSYADWRDQSNWLGKIRTGTTSFHLWTYNRVSTGVLSIFVVWRTT